jgi:hypothetical protein
LGRIHTPARVVGTRIAYSPTGSHIAIREKVLMLRITWLTGTHSNWTLKLEGKLLKLWVDEVRKACVSDTDLSGRPSLDLSALTFVDAAGAGLLWDLIGQGIEIVACSSFIAELLRACEEVKLVEPK